MNLSNSKLSKVCYQIFVGALSVSLTYSNIAGEECVAFIYLEKKYDRLCIGLGLGSLYYISIQFPISFKLFESARLADPPQCCCCGTVRFVLCFSEEIKRIRATKVFVQKLSRLRKGIRQRLAAAAVHSALLHANCKRQTLLIAHTSSC